MLLLRPEAHFRELQRLSGWPPPLKPEVGWSVAQIKPMGMSQLFKTYRRKKKI